MVLKKVKYYRTNKRYLENAECTGCGKLLRSDYHEQKTIWVNRSRSTRTYYCDKCKKRIWGGVSLRKDYPEEAIVI